MTSPAVSFFTAKLTFQTDVADVQAALATGTPDFVLIDSRGQAAWDQGRIPSARPSRSPVSATPSRR